jgi:hypothetical protein
VLKQRAVPGELFRNDFTNPEPSMITYLCPYSPRYSSPAIMGLVKDVRSDDGCYDFTDHIVQ